MTRPLTRVLMLALTLTTDARAVDLQKLVQETQHMSQAAQQITMVWWLPPAFWEASLNNSPGLTPEGRARVLSILDDYMVFALLRAKIEVGGGIDARPKAELLDNARLEINGKTIAPMAPADVKPAALSLLAGFKPALAGMLGPFGQSVEFVLYPSEKDNQKLVDPMRAGGFSYTLYDQVFKWRLPLASLLPVKLDPRTGEQFPGNYQYNPYTGDKLQAK